MVNLHAERGERNNFLVELFDPTGRKQKVTPDTLTYTIGAVVEEQPLINSMGIALANNEYGKFFTKGSGLPQRKTWPQPFRTIKALRQGQSGDFIFIPIVEGENELADRNRLIKRVAIHAENLRRDLPLGTEVELTLKIDEVAPRLAGGIRALSWTKISNSRSNSPGAPPLTPPSCKTTLRRR